MLCVSWESICPSLCIGASAFLLQLRARPPGCCFLARWPPSLAWPLQEGSFLIIHKEVLIFSLSSWRLPPCSRAIGQRPPTQNQAQPDPSRGRHTAGPWVFACLSLPSVEVPAQWTQSPLAVVFQEATQAELGGWNLGLGVTGLPLGDLENIPPLAQSF